MESKLRTDQDPFEVATDQLERKAVGEDYDSDLLNEALFTYCFIATVKLGMDSGMSQEDAVEAANTNFERPLHFEISRDPTEDGQVQWGISVVFDDEFEEPDESDDGGQ